MQAAVLQEFNAPLVLGQVPDPLAEAGWVLVKVKACGLCGTDLKIASGALPGVRTPIIPGHEIAGEVIEIGKGVTNVAPGDRVIIHFYVTCGHCIACQQGWDSLCSNLSGMIGFTINGGCAELVSAPATNIFPIGRNITFEQGAVLADAVATSYHALMKRACAQAGQTLAIIGVGGLGIHAIQIAMAMGLRVLCVDVDRAHLEAASKLGVEMVINSAEDNVVEAILGATNHKGVDILLETSGNPEAASGGVQLLATRGKMVVLGYNPDRPFEVSSHAMVLKELDICASRASTRQDLFEVIEWVSSGKIKPFIHEVIPLSQINEAYERLKSGQIIGRLVLKP